MSNIDINLIKVRDDSSAKNRKLTRLKRGALILLLSVGVISVILFLINLSSPINSIKKEQNNLLTTISESNEKAVKLSIVNERVSAVTKIRSKRPDYIGVLDLATKNLSEGVRTAGLALDESSVSITVSSPSLLSLNNFLNGVIDSSRNNSKIKSVSMESLSASDISTFYLMSVKINLNESR